MLKKTLLHTNNALVANSLLIAHMALSTGNQWSDNALYDSICDLLFWTDVNNISDIGIRIIKICPN